MTTSQVAVVDAASGVVRAARPLAQASHDAGGTILDGRAMVFGGGNAAPSNWIQRRTAKGGWQVVGTLPTSRSDLAAVGVAGDAYVLGGYDGAHLDAAVVRVAPGGRVDAVGRLPVPVRYPAVAAVGGAIWVVGGQTRSGATAVIQRFDTATGRASVIGRLGKPIEGASAVVLGGQIYVCGGVVGRSPTTQIARVNPSTGHAELAGRLPMRISYAGAATLGGTAFIVGGETPATSKHVIQLRLKAAGTATRGGR